MGETGSTGPGETSTGPDLMGCTEGCFISEVCYADGKQRPGNVCQICDAAASQTQWSDADGDMCDDGLHCNGEDTCMGGSCSVHTGDPCLDDGLFCNGTETCNDETDWCISAGDPCGAGESCSEEDQACCQQGDALGCDEDGNVVELDSCGRVGAFVATCPQLDNGLCDVGVCGCKPGFSGESCDRCVIYVSGDDGDDGDDGTTWELAKATLEAGLAAAMPELCEVWVAASDDPYTPTTGAGRNMTVQLRGGVDLYGGFAGGEISLSQRDWTVNKTTISGDLGVAGDTGDNACHVITAAEGSSIDGFVITAGRADAGCVVPDRGGAMLVDLVTANAANCTFVDNYAATFGGALAVSDGTLVAADLVFESNVSDADGGAIGVSVVVDEVGLVLTGGRLAHNAAAARGGALAVAPGMVMVTAVTFADNEAGTDGGAVFIEECNGTFDATNSVFHANEAGAAGGAISGNSDGTLINCVVALNHADVWVGGVTGGECAIGGINTVVWHNTSPDSAQVDTDCGWWEYSNIGGLVCAPPYENGNISEDPRFVSTDPSAADLSLLPGSPCIDAGNDDVATFTDLLGYSRHDDPNTDNCDPDDPGARECAWISDMGPYEYTGL